MAEFCVAMKMTPAEYKRLTLVEYQEFVNAFSRSKGSDIMEELI